MPHQEHACRIAAAGRNVLAHPAHRGGHVLRPGRPLMLGRQAVGDVDADDAVARGIQHDVVVEGAAGAALVAAGEGASMHVQQHRTRGPVLLVGRKHVQSMARAGSAGLITAPCSATFHSMSEGIPPGWACAIDDTSSTADTKTAAVRCMAPTRVVAQRLRLKYASMATMVVSRKRPSIG